MFLTKHKKSNQWLLAASLSALLALPVSSIAATEVTTDESRTTRSISFAGSSELDKAAKDALLKQAEADVMAPLLKEGFRVESRPLAVHIVNSSYSGGDITLFDASTDLISDMDYDGFYHRFSVTIDADTVYDTSYVYARLYLSYEGGPWNHYATSDAYHIHADSSSDTFTIETELADGFPAGYYDVRIDLYDADHDTWVTNYGPYEDSSLSALPLEDSYYDDGYHDYVDGASVEVGVAVGVGATGGLIAILPALLLLLRRQVSNREKIIG